MSRLRISDHALVRFLDLAGAGVEEVRLQLEMGLDRAYRAACQIEASEYLISVDGCTFLVRNGALVTVLAETTVGQRAHTLVRPEADRP